jgi:hypothetical protein
MLLNTKSRTKKCDILQKVVRKNVNLFYESEKK